MLAVAITMAIGGLLNAKKLGLTMSTKITTMNSGQGLTANLITGLLVTTTSIHASIYNARAHRFYLWNRNCYQKNRL